MPSKHAWLAFLIACGAHSGEQTVAAEQIAIPRVERMPNIPQPFKMRDWRALAHAYDRFIFDFNAKGEFLPLVWWDDSRININRATFGLPAYVGTPNATGTRHEGGTCLAAVLGATIAGIDKSQGEHNWVLMCEAYYNRKNGENLVLNGVSAHSGGSFWYDLWNHILFYALADRYPKVGSLEAIMRTTADRWHDACVAMGGDKGVPDFNHTAFAFRTMKPVDNGRWREPDSAAGIAWLEYMAWIKWRDPKHLQAADWAMQFLNAWPEGPLYEVLMPFGAHEAGKIVGHRVRVDRPFQALDNQVGNFIPA